MPALHTSSATELTATDFPAGLAPGFPLDRPTKGPDNQDSAEFSLEGQIGAAVDSRLLQPDPSGAFTPAAFIAGSTRLSAIQQFLRPIEHSVATRARFERRLRVLAEEAQAEGYAFNPDSEVAFRWFLDQHPFLEAGRLFLMDNGNLRVTWKHEPDTHVGLQFLPDDSVQYVIFTRRPSSRTISRVHGYDTLEGVPRLLAAYDLGHILGR